MASAQSGAPGDGGTGPHPPRPTTDEPDWYAEQLTAVRAAFRIVAPPELREAARVLGQRLLRADTLSLDEGHDD
ncbi:hypothetical protein OG978_38760 [Streptomyces sp. NBC_01591]|uniref:hypothetical protein n=1 Tax=Streptomyces sp. NBC_01591 TaxID=2975888 RepID=UPI002DDBCB52|nr:hypothetical protein [Streptomyces sp. NBC_01591]WSD72802.1 hypothetical protein OG978_38760 [Streptomyces sp. NBC_01591]